MNESCSALAAVVAELREEISCSAGPDGVTSILTTGRFFSDGEPVEISVRINAGGTRLAVSDGGALHTRRALIDQSEMSGSVRKQWDAIIRDYSLEEYSDRVYGVCGPGEVFDVITSISDACIALDSLRLMVEGERETFGATFRSWLAGLDVDLVDSKNVTDRWGNPQKPTALVNSKRGHIAIQAAPGRSVGELRRPVEHAYFLFDGLDSGAWPLSSRLTVFQGVSKRRGRSSAPQIESLVSRLASVSSVASFDAAEDIKRFFDEDPGEQRDFVTLGFGQTRL